MVIETLNAISMLREDESLEILTTSHCLYLIQDCKFKNAFGTHFHSSCGQVYNESAALAFGRSLRDFY